MLIKILTHFVTYIFFLTKIAYLFLTSNEIYIYLLSNFPNSKRNYRFIIKRDNRINPPILRLVTGFSKLVRSNVFQAIDSHRRP